MIFASCSKENISTTIEKNINSLSPEDAKAKFAQILSCAVSDNIDLRIFIHEEAMKQFDMDYDVFYPFVRDVKVSKDMTFREILLQYTTEPELKEIESTEPKLNILVPDWKWIGCFSIKDWDPVYEITAVGYESLSKNKTVYANGKKIGELKPEQFPGFPLIIVKSNERMTSRHTKSGVTEFDFIDEAFNPTSYPKTRVEHEYYDILIDGEPDVSNFVPASNLSNQVINAYNEFINNDYAAHRDYIYYGMTNENTIGKLNVHINEVIHKIKFSKSYDSIDGINENGDFIDKEQTLEYKQNDGWKSIEELRDIFYSDGSIELKFYITTVNKKGESNTINKSVPIKFEDVFAISHSFLDFRHKTWFAKDWFVYSIDYSYIYPKWFEVDLRIPNWDISSESSSVYVMVEEYDDGTIYTYENTIEATFLTNFSINHETSGTVGNNIVSGTVKDGLGYGSTTTEKKSSICKIQRTNTSDDFGTAYLNYMDPVIIGTETKNNINGYKVKVYDTGTVDMMIIPIYE